MKMVPRTKIFLTFAIVATFLVHHGNNMLYSYHVPRTAPVKIPTPKATADMIKEKADQMWKEYFVNQDLQFIFPGIAPLPFCRGPTVRIGLFCSPLPFWF